MFTFCLRQAKGLFVNIDIEEKIVEKLSFKKKKIILKVEGLVDVKISI